MSRVNFTQIWSPNEEVTRLQSHIKTALNPLLELPISDGILIKGLSIETTDTRVNHGLGREYEGFIITRLQSNAVIYESCVNHGLGREYEGFIITRLQSNAVIYESSTINGDKNLFILLKGSGAATADIYFF